MTETTDVAARLKPGDPPSIEWNEGRGYKLIQLAEPMDLNFDLPGDEATILFERLLKQSSILLFSELEGGRKNFLACYQGYLNTIGIAWVSIDCDAWARASFDYSWRDETNSPSFPLLSASDKQTKKTPADLLAALERLAAEPPTGNRLDELKPWIKLWSSPTNTESNPKPALVVFLRNFSGLNKPNAQTNKAESVAMALRQLYEASGQSCALQTIIVDLPNSALLDSDEQSGYAALCHQYRLPFLSLDEIKQLGSDLPLTADAWDCVYDHTGGQPLLVQTCLRRLRVEHQSDTEISARHIDRIAAIMHNNPPSVTKKWQEQLRVLLTLNPHLIIPMQAYARGETLGKVRFPPPMDERVLFLAGWLKVNRHGRWGVSSHIHVNLALPVLDSIK